MTVRISKINKSFGKKQVLIDTSMTLQEGGIYCLMGPSGMGKTTLLRILMGFETADSGEVRGIDSKEISAMFQEDRLFPTLTATQNVAIVYKKRPSQAKLRENLMQILPKECLGQPVSQLSGGMKRRVALARAMHFPGKMVILDEPFTGLDHDTKEEVISYIKSMRGNRILLVATHGLDDAALLGAEVIHLEECQGAPLLKREGEQVRLPKKSREEILSEMTMFRGIPLGSYEGLIERMHGREEQFEPGELILRQFEATNRMGIVLDGLIEASTVCNNEKAIVQQFYAGNAFGEAIAFGGQSSFVDVRALVPTRVLFLSADRIIAGKDDPELAQIGMNLLEEMAAKLAILNMKNQLLTEPRLRSRILKYVNTIQPDEDGMRTLPFNQTELAQYLSVNRVSVSRELSRMREEQILFLDGRRIRILQADIEE